MTPQEQAALEAEQKAKAEAEARDAENQIDKQEVNQNDGSDTQNKIDYKAIAETEKKARAEAEKAAADLAFKLREAKRKSEEISEIENAPEEKPITVSDLQSLLSEQEQRLEKRLSSSTVSKIAKKYASSPEEAEAIIETHRNRQFPPTHSLEEQVKEAYAIVNADKIMGINKELARALNNKGGVNDNTASSHFDALSAGEPKVSTDVKGVLMAQGFVYNNSTHRYEKKVGNKILFRDNATGKVLTA